MPNKQPAFVERELTILKLICQEWTSSEIAERVGLSAKRVEGIRLELLNKTKSRNMVGLVKYAIKMKIYTLK